MTMEKSRALGEAGDGAVLGSLAERDGCWQTRRVLVKAQHLLGGGSRSTQPAASRAEFPSQCLGGYSQTWALRSGP